MPCPGLKDREPCASRARAVSRDVTRKQVNEQTLTPDASCSGRIMSDFDDADIFEGVAELPRFDPEAKRKREEEHERSKADFHKKIYPPRKKRQNQKKEYQGVDWVAVEKKEYESALFEHSLVLVKGIWMRKGKPTRSIWFPSVIVPRIAWGSKGFDLARGFHSSDVPVWELGTRLGAKGVFWAGKNDIKPFRLSVDVEQQCAKWPKKFRDEFAQAYQDAVRLVSVIKTNEERRGTRWDRQREEEEARAEAEEAYRKQCEASLSEEDRKKIREAGERFVATVLHGMS